MRTDLFSVSAIALSVILILAVAIPATSHLVSDYRTNQGLPYYSVVADGGHTIVISEGDEGIIVTVDDKIVPIPDISGTSAITAGTASFLGISVYEASASASRLASVAGTSPSAGMTSDAMQIAAFQNNIDNYNGTYGMMSYNQWQLYRLMSVMLTGTMDTQSVMGPGITAATSPSNTGQTHSWYSVSSSSTSAISLLIENPYGNTLTILGDTAVSDQTIMAGSDIGGNIVSKVNNALPNVSYSDRHNGTGLINNYSYTITDILDNAQTWGLPSGLSFYRAGNINDTITLSGSNNSDAVVNAIAVGGSFVQNTDSGIFTINGHISDTDTSAILGTRLSYLVRENSAVPSMTIPTYTYRFAYSADGAIGATQTFINGSWSTVTPVNDGLNPYWTFSNGIGPFGTFYAAVNVHDGINADDSTEDRLNKSLGGIGYILNPNDWTKTLAGNSFTPSEYNIMLIIPTVYWGVNDGYVYLSNNATSVPGVSMSSYAHTFTVDPTLDTLNPSNDKSIPITLGASSGVLLYGNGNVVAYSGDTATVLGNATDGITMTFNGKTMTSGTTILEEMTYHIAESGDYVLASTPSVMDDTGIAMICYGTVHDNLGNDHSHAHIIGGTIAHPIVNIAGTSETVTSTMNVSTNDHKITAITITDNIDTATATLTIGSVIVPVSVNVSDNGILGRVIGVMPIILLMICLAAIGSYAYIRRGYSYRW